MNTAEYKNPVRRPLNPWRHQLRPIAAAGFLLIALVVLMVLPSGKAAAADPALSIDPTSFDFGAKNIGGEVSYPGEFTITNESGSNVTVNEAALRDNSPLNFLIPPTWDGCRGVLLEPNEKCYVAVMFEPSVEGDVTANLTINSDAEDPGPSSALKGHAYPRLLPTAAVTPRSADFGVHGLGTTSNPRVFELKDDGLGDLGIEAATLDGLNADDFSITSDKCRNRVIASGMTCEVTVVFRPGTAGIRKASLNIPTTDEDADTRIELTGTGAGIVPDPPGTAKVKLGTGLPRVKAGKLNLNVTCETERMDRCDGRIRAFASGKALGLCKPGWFMLARGAYSVGPGSHQVMVKLERRANRALKRRRFIKSKFEVTVAQEDADSIVSTVKRNIRAPFRRR